MTERTERDNRSERVDRTEVHEGMPKETQL
jgi:hypothetical protein